MGRGGTQRASVVSESAKIEEDRDNRRLRRASKRHDDSVGPLPRTEGLQNSEGGHDDGADILHGGGKQWRRTWRPRVPQERLAEPPDLAERGFLGRELQFCP